MIITLTSYDLLSPEHYLIEFDFAMFTILYTITYNHSRSVVAACFMAR
jgi:hypothetical protein